MNKNVFYTINASEVVESIAYTCHEHFEQVQSFTIPRAPLAEKLERLEKYLNLKNQIIPEIQQKHKKLYLGTVLWMINNGHQVEEPDLNSAYNFALELYDLSFTERLNLSFLFAGYEELFRQLRRECLQEELSLIMAHARGDDLSGFKLPLLENIRDKFYQSHIFNSLRILPGKRSDETIAVRFSVTKARHNES